MKKRVPGLDFLTYGFVRVFAGLINLFPIEISSWIACRLGDLGYLFLAKRRKTALENLESALKDHLLLARKEQIARESFQSLAMSLMEFFRTPAMLSEASRRFEFEGTEHMDAAFKKGKGVIFTIAHLGSWEYLGFLPYLRGYPCSVIVRPIKNPYIYRWIQRLRRETRLHPIDRNQSVKEILKRLKSNELVAILIDQWAGPDGLWLDFFGRPTSVTSIPARLASRTGAVMIPGYCVRTAPGKFKIVILPEVPLAEGGDFEKETTESLNRMLEREIIKYLPQWSWAHRRWKPKSRYRAAAE